MGLEAIQEYLDTKVHPKVIRQLEIWHACQSDGSTVAESMRRQVCAFYDSNMEANTPEDWLKLLLYATCTDKEILTKILAKTRDLDTPHQIIDFVDAEECGKNKANGLLGGRNIAARAGLEGGGNTGGRTPKCFLCQALGHSKNECTVDPSTLWCDHCKTRKHNTYKFCPKNKNRNKPKDNPKDKKDTKGPKLKPRRGGQARTVKNDEQNDEVPEGEDDEDDDSSDLVLYSLRLKWWPYGDGTDDDLESSSEPEVFYLDSEDEDTDSSGNESGYFIPPNSPAEMLSVEDFMTEDKDEPLHPPLLSDSEPSDSEEDEDSEDNENDTPIRRYLNDKINSSVARGREDQIPPGARIW